MKSYRVQGPTPRSGGLVGTFRWKILGNRSFKGVSGVWVSRLV